MTPDPTADDLVGEARHWVGRPVQEPLLRLIQDLADRVEALEPCGPCKEERHDDCTGACPSMCCALAYEQAANADLTDRLGEALQALEKVDREEDWDVALTRVLANPANRALYREYTAPDDGDRGDSG